MPTASPIARPNGIGGERHATARPRRSGCSIGQPVPRPGPDAAVGDVDDLARRRGARSSEAATALRWPGGADRRRPGAAGRCPSGMRVRGRGRARGREPGMWPSSHSPRSRTSSTCTRVDARSCSAVDVDALDRARSGASPRASWSSRRPGSRRGCVIPTARGQVRGADRVLVVAADEHDLAGRGRRPRRASCRSRRGPPGCRPRPGCARRRTAGRCGRRRRARPRAASSSTWRGGQRLDVDAAGVQRAAVERDDRLEVRRLRRQRARSRARRTRPRRPRRSRSLWRALVADRRGDLHVHPGPAAQRAAEVPGPDLARRRAASAACRAASGTCRARPRSLSTARSGRAMSPTNSVSPVSTAHGSGAAGGVDQRERRVLGPVAGRVQRAHAHAPELELPAVVERLVVVVGRRRRGGRGSSRRSPPRAGRGRRRGRRGCGSRGCARSRTPM